MARYVWAVGTAWWRFVEHCSALGKSGNKPNDPTCSVQIILRDQNKSQECLSVLVGLRHKHKRIIWRIKAVGKVWSERARR